LARLAKQTHQVNIKPMHHQIFSTTSEYYILNIDRPISALKTNKNHDMSQNMRNPKIITINQKFSADRETDELSFKVVNKTVCFISINLYRTFIHFSINFY